MTTHDAIYTHSTGTQPVQKLDHNGEDMTLVRFENGTETWVCDSDLSPADARLTYTVAVNGRKVEARYVDDAAARVSVRLQYRDSGHHVTVWRSGELILELGL